MHTRGIAYEVGMLAVTCANTSNAASLTSTGCSKQAESCKQLQKARANDQHSKQLSSAPASASPAVTQALLAHSMCPDTMQHQLPGEACTTKAATAVEQARVHHPR